MLGPQTLDPCTDGLDCEIRIGDPVWRIRCKFSIVSSTHG